MTPPPPRPRRDARHILEPILVGLGLTALFCLLFGVTLGAYFSVVEEHHILSGADRPLSDWPGLLLSDVELFGRVRPVFFLFHGLKLLLFGTNPTPFHVLTIALGVWTSFLFYCAARRTGADALSALAFVLLLSITATQSVVWYQVFAPQETLGMFLTGVTVWACVRASAVRVPGIWDTIWLSAIALAGLTKESFVLLIPAVLLLRWSLHCWFGRDSWRSALGTIRRPLQVGAAIFAVEVAVPLAIVLGRSSSYAAQVVGLSPSAFDPRLWWHLLRSDELGRLSPYFLIALLILAVHGWRHGHRNPSARAYTAAAVVVASAWLLPQLVLYNQRLFERYLFPGIVAPAGVIALALSVLRRRSSWVARVAWVVGLVSLVPLFARGVAETSTAAGRYAAETKVVRDVTRYLARTVGVDRAIVIAADPATPYGFEAAYALPAYLRHAGSRSRIYLWPVLHPAHRTALHEAVADATAAAFAAPGALRASDIGGIAVPVLPTALGPVPPWFASAPWREVVFSRAYHSFALAKGRYVRAGHVTQRVLVHGEEGPGIPGDHALVLVAPALRGHVGVNPLLATPWWGLERDGSGSVLWLGDGADSAMTSLLWAARDQPVRISCEVVVGPGRADQRRTVELSLASADGVRTDRQVFEGAAVLTFTGELHRGRNELTLRVLDHALVRRRPGGDTRPLLVALRRVTISPPPH